MSICFTFDHGAVYVGGGETAAEWFEKPFGDVEAAQFTPDLRRSAPAPVRD